MMEHAVYSVISLEGCAAILERCGPQEGRGGSDEDHCPGHEGSLGVIDEIIPEPPGGAHADPAGASAAVGEAIERHLKEVKDLTTEERRERRYRKFRALGATETAAHP
jgi:acetyl-CoA carboxylase carboxyl transferase subunit alpha